MEEAKGEASKSFYDGHTSVKHLASGDSQYIADFVKVSRFEFTYKKRNQRRSLKS